MTSDFLEARSGIKLDTSQWPVLIMTTPEGLGETDASELREFMDLFYDFIREKKERYALVLNLLNMKNLSSNRRQIHNLAQKSNKELTQKYCSCTALVFESAVLRGVLQAMFWMMKPSYPTKVFKTVEEAISWAKTQV